MTGSLAYRKNEAAIHRGDVPEKYTRLLPYIPGQNILEIGSAEGVLALLLARMGRNVTALEKSEERHSSANELYSRWEAREGHFVAPTFVNASIGERLDLLNGKDTLVAIRMIYYLGSDLDRIFAKAAQKVKNVVLCGNKNRAASYRAGIEATDSKADNYYASAAGMRDVLKRHGYRIVFDSDDEGMEGDPIVVGRMG